MKRAFCSTVATSRFLCNDTPPRPHRDWAILANEIPISRCASVAMASLSSIFLWIRLLLILNWSILTPFYMSLDSFKLFRLFINIVATNNELMMSNSLHTEMLSNVDHNFYDSLFYQFLNNNNFRVRTRSSSTLISHT